MKKNVLSIENLYSSIDGKEILKGIDLTVKSGEIHAIMGPNGAGKTTLAMSLMGNPGYKSQMGNAKFDLNGKDMIPLLPEERARNGLFVSFQQPIEVTGVSVLSFLRTADKALHSTQKIPLSQFKQEVRTAFNQVGLDDEFMKRSLNEGFSGGEKKRTEIAQLLVLKPQFAILDEIDSGLDIDSLKLVAQAIKRAVKKYKMGILVITHYQRILHFLKPDYVHVLIDGKIKKSDGMSLVRRIEKNGYAAI